MSQQLIVGRILEEINRGGLGIVEKVRAKVDDREKNFWS